MYLLVEGGMYLLVEYGLYLLVEGGMYLLVEYGLYLLVESGSSAGRANARVFSTLVTEDDWSSTIVWRDILFGLKWPEGGAR
ncbi:hypothetical protein XELAEV_18034359mg [Xenopus laevis]|uniref:Uncharacterized protein n=1 Tax=Xenopus laevis TaxID=8355 RepID=A0A974CDS5_XENLA|nr:hypothetical protein XELAEV_18034359mg [Xenopus laevis]